MKKVLFIVCHPHLRTSLAQKSILEQVQGSTNFTIHDLYENYPDFFIDVNAEKERLLQHDTVVFQHPLYWYNMPALLKQWFDDVLEFGFAYGPGGDALKGKDYLVSITAGGGAEAYNREGYNYFSMDELLTPHRQTARLIQMKWHDPMILHSSRSTSVVSIQKHAQDLIQKIQRIQNETLVNV